MKFLIPRISLLSLFALSILFLLNGCKKNDYKPEEVQSSRTTPYVVLYSPMHIEIPAGLEDKSGNVFPVNKLLANGRTTADFPGCSDRTYLIKLIYNGFTATRYTVNSTYDVYHTWTVEVPSDDYTLLSSTTIYKGYQRFVNAVIGGNSPCVTSTYSLSTPTSFTVNDNGSTVNMKRYIVNYTITMPESDFCNNETFHTYPKIKSDCSEYPTIVPIGSPSYYVGSFTPNAYRVYTYGAMNNGSDNTKHQFDTYPLIVTPAPCHSGSLGSSPTHIIFYRKQGTSTWGNVTSTNLATVTVDVTSSGAGTYECQSKGIVTSGVYSTLTPISTFTVN